MRSLTRFLPAGVVAAALLVAAPPAREPITFRDVTRAAGIHFTFKTDLRRGRMISTMGGGVALGDFDGDGFPDLFFTGSVRNGKKPDKGPCGALYRNRGDGTFENVTARSGIRSCGWAMGASWVDVDSEGSLDLVVTGLGKTALWKNQGDGTFREVSAERGIQATRFAIGLAAGDVNGDGRVDLYVVNYLDTTYEKEISFPRLQVRTPEDYDGQEAFLFIQRENGTFEEAAQKAGVSNHGGKGLGGLFFDFDGDGKPDLYVSNDRAPNVLYRNRGDGTFEDVTRETGAGSRDQPTPRAGMGIAVGDVDGDGHPDLLVTNFAGEPNTLYRNVEGQLFDDGSRAAGLEKASFPYVQWGTDFVDLDNDGLPDLVAVSGHLVPSMFLHLAGVFRKGGLGEYGSGDRSYRQPPLVWRNRGGGRFEDVSAVSGDLAKVRLSARGMAASDIDGDGFIDIAIAAISGGVRLFRNETPAAGRHALEILPVAGSDRRTVLGTKVIVTTVAGRQVQEFIVRPSYASGSWVPLHFGLGTAETVERVEVIPPGETAVRWKFDHVAGGRLYTLRDGALEVRREFRK